MNEQSYFDNDVSEFMTKLVDQDAKRLQQALAADDARTQRPAVRYSETTLEGHVKEVPLTLQTQEGEVSAGPPADVPPSDGGTPPGSGIVYLTSYARTMLSAAVPPPGYSAYDDAYQAAAGAIDTNEETEYHDSYFNFSNDDTGYYVGLTSSAIDSYFNFTDGSDETAGYVSWQAVAAKARWYFEVTCTTGYVKLYWNDVFLQNNVAPVYGETYDNVVISSTPQTYEYSGPELIAGGYLTPEREITTAQMEPSDPLVADADGYSPTTRRIIHIAQIRYSFVEGYVPPEDGSANGFPPDS